MFPTGRPHLDVSLLTPNGLLESQVLDRFAGITKLDQGIYAYLEVHSCILLCHGLIALGSFHSFGSRRIKASKGRPTYLGS